MHRDPITGDQLTTAEWVTGHAQNILRSPWFIVAFNVVTVICFLHGHGWENAWNWMASWLAIMVEWMVGKFMWGQTKRDAVYIRRIVALEERVIALEEVNHKQLEHLEYLVGQTRPQLPAGRQDCLCREAAEAA